MKINIGDIKTVKYSNDYRWNVSVKTAKEKFEAQHQTLEVALLKLVCVVQDHGYQLVDDLGNE